jgi:hypothetical protein
MYRGRRFLEHRGWYEVPTAVADELAELKQPPGAFRHSDDVPLAFDVMSKTEAKVVDKKEAREAARKSADEPVDMTTSDLRRDVEPPKRTAATRAKRKRDG